MAGDTFWNNREQAQKLIDEANSLRPVAAAVEALLKQPVAFAPDCIGEAATIGSTPAVVNAVVDALSHLNVRHVDMPATPERIAAAVRAARQAR